MKCDHGRDRRLALRGVVYADGDDSTRNSDRLAEGLRMIVPRGEGRARG
jgi:hypothetical protein